MVQTRSHWALTHKCVCVCATSQVRMTTPLEKHSKNITGKASRQLGLCTFVPHVHYMFISSNLGCWAVTQLEVMRWRQGLKDGERSFLAGAWSFRERQLQLDWAIWGTGPWRAEVVYTKASGVSLKRSSLAMMWVSRTIFLATWIQMEASGARLEVNPWPNTKGQ